MNLPALRLMAALILAALPHSALAIDWPQEVDAPEGKIFVYQPQPESRARVADRASGTPDFTQARPATDRRNDVLADS